jgi:cell division protein FtsN
VASRDPIPPAPPAVAQAPPRRTATPPPAPPKPTHQWRVQVAAFGDPAKAEHLRHVLASRFADASVDPVDTAARRFYRVSVGPYTAREDALARAERINRLGYPAVLSETPLP